MSYIPHLIAIGTSIGGPAALEILLSGIPADFPASILIVQHMPSRFTSSFAKRLDGLVGFHVVEGKNHEPLQIGRAYIAPGDYHMVVQQQENGELFLSTNKKPPRHGLRPSVDALFESLSLIRHPSISAVILTGMGCDGTSGLKKLKEKGIQVILAEDETTCAVFGMPRSAIQAGVVDEVVPIYEMANQLLRCLNH
jgi:two-component system chemotaxis response regulator CheB